MGFLYDCVVEIEIKMKYDTLTCQSKLSTNLNTIIGFYIVIFIQGEGKDLETSDNLIMHMQEEFKKKLENLCLFTMVLQM